MASHDKPVEESPIAGLAGALNGECIPPILRVLLTTDGTVTKSLEAYFWEPIEVVGCAQALETLKAQEPLLGRQQGEQVLQRRVQLIGRRSRTLYAEASSVIAVTSLPNAVREGLESGRLGIGELVRDCGFESYRQIIEMGRSGSELGLESPALWRRYLIRMGGKPLILIKETFPLEPYRASTEIAQTNT